MEESSLEMGWEKLSYDRWEESHVSSWLRSIGIKENHIKKMDDEEVTGPVLTSLEKDYLRTTIGMKGAQIEHLLKKRDELLKSQLKLKKHTLSRSEDKMEEKVSGQKLECLEEPCDTNQRENLPMMPNENSSNTEVDLTFCDFRKFDQHEMDCRYVKHNVFPPETGSENLIDPCHEYKSLEIAHTLDSQRLKTKVASEVLRFACGCMNMRANGTIHFGVMDSVKGTHKHGEIIGIPLKNQEDFVDALDYIERCFKDSNQQCDARSCIRNPRFIEVLDKDTTEKTWVIEYDVVPKASIVKNKFYSVGIPKFSEKDNKVKCEKNDPYRRVGANTQRIPEEDYVLFIQELSVKDKRREEAESYSNEETDMECREDQSRKLSILLTCGKTYMDNNLFYILVTNKFQPEHLDRINFLIPMNLFCVFDFDPDSNTSGLCGRFKKEKVVNLHFLDDYNRLGNADCKSNLQLFERTSWIFCNGRNDIPAGEQPCDEKTWIKTKKKKLKKVVSLICNDILPKSSFVVLFLLVSDVEQPLVETFHEFFAEMNGHDFLAVISESKKNYKKWSSLAQVSCPMSTLEEISIVQMPLSHVDATVQNIQLSQNKPTRKIPVLNGGLCFLKSVEEARMDSLEIISVDQCEETKLDVMSEDEIKQTDVYFYRGGKIKWINFWFADKHKCGKIIERDAYKEANTVLEPISHYTKANRPIESVNIYHHPGSGGSTVARQILWSWRTKVRCAVVKPCKEITTVCEHAVQLREHEEKDKNQCLPVLLLLEDQKKNYIDDLRQQLGSVIATKKINTSVLCFILLICNRSNDPEKMRRASPSQTVAVTHKLSIAEKPMFTAKLKELKLEYEPEFILTFVLMSEDFSVKKKKTYIKDFVKNVLDKVDHSSPVTRLIRLVALLNCYVKNSYISVSHCEASLGLTTYLEKTRYHAFVDHLTEEARLIFIHLKESSTHLSSLRIIHSLVAKEILRQLPKNLSQSDIAMDLISDKILISHRFNRDEFLQFVKDLFIRRNKKSRGDEKDTVFSPLIEHVSVEKGGVQKAVDLMKAAYLALGKDGFVAQQLARLLYSNLRFEEALEWAETAKYFLPFDTFVLDTLGQVYKRWFYHLYDTLDEKSPSPERGTEIISTALKGISAFRTSEKTPKKENLILNNSYYGEVDVGCMLLKFLSEIDVFANDTGNSEFMKYLLTDYIPDEVKKPWHKFHSQLKGLEQSLYQALEYISEDLSYFQTDTSEVDEDLDERDPEIVNNPRGWLTRKSAVYAGFFCNIPDKNQEAESKSTDSTCQVTELSPLQRKMRIYKLGGGNVTSILTLLHDNDTARAGRNLETIVDTYPENMRSKELDQKGLVNFIFCQLALNCTLPGSSKLKSLQQLQDLSKRFNTKGRNMASASALFLLSLLFWPETDNLSPESAQILLSAIDALQRLCEQKLNVSPRKSRVATHFFLGIGRGLNKIVHRSAIERHVKGTLSERRLKWLGGEIWKTREVVQSLKRVEGWTENGNLFVKVGTKDSKCRVFPRYSSSLPHGNENVTFYLGFSFDGVFAFDIQVKD